MKVNVKVISNNAKKVPLDFPWISGVHLSLQGDVTFLENLTKELEEVKSMVNKDISKFNMNLKDFSIKIEFI